jgi:hypothetical protein
MTGVIAPALAMSRVSEGVAVELRKQTSGDNRLSSYRLTSCDDRFWPKRDQATCRL